ncbi:MAG TPA: cupredoxin domain-containing protein [Thermoleophilaceae bacterium]|nr:cupredoxin domain-containing protein [Thermoleophilaceae bacterium]
MHRPLTAALALLALGACGGDKEEKEGPAVTVQAGGSARVVAKEYSFDPGKVVLRGPGRLRITLVNEGSLAHNLKVTKDDRRLGGTPTFEGGRTESGTVELRRGTYEMVCTVGDHAELGMTGTLEVR